MRYAEHKRTEFGDNYTVQHWTIVRSLPTTPDLALPMAAWNGTVSPMISAPASACGPGYLQHFWVLDPNAIAAWQSTYNNVLTGPNYQGNFTIDEKDSAAVYGMANLTRQSLARKHRATARRTQ